MAQSEGIRLKKKHGQHFLRDHTVIEAMIDRVVIDTKSSIFEIGCGDGFLTRALLKTLAARVYVFEIDHEWASYVRSQMPSDRLFMFEQNFLDLDPSVLAEHAPWTVLANLPYNVTFPILHYFQRSRHLLKEGVIMIQEEVAQRLVAQRGSNYGFVSLFFQYYFELSLMTKIPPGSFYPPPKVFSRLIYFKPRQELIPIPDIDRFWIFIKACFKQPRRTLYNNIKQFTASYTKLDPALLALRAQQLSMQDFLALWDVIR